MNKETKLMEKVGLVSVSIHNYGSLLQTYAIQKVLDDLNVENEIILFKSHPIKQIYRIFNVPFATMKLKLYKRKLVTKLFYKEIFEGSAKRDEEFMNFKKTYCRFTKKSTSRKELLEWGKSYKAFVLGSDQVWNPANLEMDFYTLNFAEESKAKIAYAPSFGVSVIPEKQMEATRNYLQRVQYISVRETAGAKIVKELTGRDVPVVCDPTTLLTREQWDELKSDKKYIDEKYMFCYFLGGNPEHRNFVRRVREVTGYKIVALQHIDEFVKSDLDFADVAPFDVGPRDFLNLISNAEYVFTDSFHCTVFSTYYHKNFFTFPRYQENKKDSTNSRVISILNLFDLQERFLRGNENVEETIGKNIEWDRVQNKLETFRESSYEYLLDALRGSKLIQK